jgi:glutamyl-tRNA synthetase
MSEVRTRFAPSPTGYMHIGNLRTALYTYLIAKKEGGKFILRIEDTDQERYVEGATDIIYRTLKTVGLNWDEGPDIGGPVGPYIQSERMGIFKQYAVELVEKGAAYYCFCDKDRLAELKAVQEASGVSPMYDRHCRNLSKEEVEAKLAEGVPYVIRQKIPLEGTTTFHDELFGDITVENSTLDDQILLKADGMPTYNFANVVDDHLMGITHVVRGNEYLASAPKYNLLYEAFGWDIPKYIHVSPIMKDKHSKLSKRNGDASFEDLVAKGYLSEAIINYIALLGWAPKGEREIYSLEELKQEFDIEGLSKSPSIFDPLKLRAINGEYIRMLTPEKFLEHATPYIRETVKREDVDLSKISALLQNRTEVFTDIPEQVDFIDEMPDYDLALYENKKMKTNCDTALDALERSLPVMEAIEDWRFDVLHDELFKLIADMGVKNGYILWPVRVAISGKQFTPGGAFEIAEIIGKDETVSRMKRSIEMLKLISA